MTLRRNASAVDSDGAARDAFLAMFFAADRRCWGEVLERLADQVHLDYSSLNGSEPGVRSATEIVAAWRSFVPGYDSTHHLLVVVGTEPDGDSVRLVANGTTTHKLESAVGDPLWTVAGHYAARLVSGPRGWVISSLVFTCSWCAGNQDLPSHARQRVADARAAERA